MDKIVNVLILLFIVVFDPLAICLVLAFNFLNTKSIESDITVDKLPLDPINPVKFKEDSKNDELEIVLKKQPIVIDEILPVQPSETPQISSEIESLSTNTQLDEMLDIYNENDIDFERRKMEKAKKRMSSYSGATST